LKKRERERGKEGKREVYKYCIDEERKRWRVLRRFERKS